MEDTIDLSGDSLDSSSSIGAVGDTSVTNTVDLSGDSLDSSSSIGSAPISTAPTSTISTAPTSTTINVNGSGSGTAAQPSTTSAIMTGLTNITKDIGNIFTGSSTKSAVIGRPVAGSYNAAGQFVPITGTATSSLTSSLSSLMPVLLIMGLVYVVIMVFGGHSKR